MLSATATYINATGGVNGQNPTEITRPDIDLVIQTLAGNDAWTIERLQDGSLKFGSAPIRDAYVALGSTKLIGQLDNVAGFIAKTQYPNQTTVSQSEYGSVSNVRYYLSSIGSFTPNASNTGQNVYNVFHCGMESYAVIEQDRASAAFIYRPPIYDGPLALNVSVGYKTALVPRILNDQWLLNLRVTLA
jgi:N4-gp56 family major capsid protein